MPTMTGIPGTVADMKETTSAGMKILTATGIIRDQAEGTGSGTEISWQSN